MDFNKPEDLFKDAGNVFKTAKDKMPKVNLNKAISVGIFVFLLVVSALTCFYSVGPDEVGVVRRFGKYVRQTSPGLHFKVPFSIEKVNNVKVKYIFKEEFGFRTEKPGVITRYSSKSFYEESLMLTGDLNVLVVEWVTQFKVKDPIKLLFNIRNPGRTLRNISEAVMRQMVGDYSVNEVLTTRRVEINQAVQDKMQEILDSYDTGIQIVTVKLQDVNPADPVKPSFNEVNEAKQEKEKVINQARQAYNKVIPKARGEAEKTIRNAEGYALNRVNRAQGDASKFTQTWNAYKNSKEVTRKRLFLEAMSEVLPKAGKKFVIDSDQKSVLPLLSLSKEGGAK